VEPPPNRSLPQFALDPLNARPLSSTRSQDYPTPTEGARMKRQYTILAVDDESDVLLIVKTALQVEGYRVLTAADGPDALKTAHDEKPDLVLLDVMMPGMDGFEVLDKLRQDDVTCRIPVIMLTGLSERERKRSAIERGTKYYIVKPFDFQDLVSKVRLAIEDTEAGIF
jgi:DNA-binding response OmpR family regulator